MFFFVLMVYCLKQYKLHCFPTSPYSSFIHFLDLKFAKAGYLGSTSTYVDFTGVC